MDQGICIMESVFQAGDNVVRWVGKIDLFKNIFGDAAFAGSVFYIRTVRGAGNDKELAFVRQSFLRKFFIIIAVLSIAKFFWGVAAKRNNCFVFFLFSVRA